MAGADVRIPQAPGQVHGMAEQARQGEAGQGGAQGGADGEAHPARRQSERFGDDPAQHARRRLHVYRTRVGCGRRAQARAVRIGHRENPSV